MPTFNAFNTAMVRVTVVAGAAAETAVAVPGIAPGDVLLMVLHQTAAGVLDADLTAETTVTAVGEITLAETATTGGQLVVLWLDVSQAEA